LHILLPGVALASQHRPRRVRDDIVSVVASRVFRKTVVVGRLRCGRQFNKLLSDGVVFERVLPATLLCGWRSRRPHASTQVLADLRQSKSALGDVYAANTSILSAFAFYFLLYLFPLFSSVLTLRIYTTHTRPFNGPFSGTTRVSRYQKGKTNLDFTKARDSEWQWHQLDHMQVCTSLQTDNHASIPPLSYLQAGCPSCRPTNSVNALEDLYYLG